MSRRIVDRSLRITPFTCLQCRRHAAIVAPTKRAFSTTPTQNDERSSLLALLQSRGLINQLAASAPLLRTILAPDNKNKPAFYAGIDPTAPSLHLGHLLPLMVLFWAAAHGFPAISLVGSATARVGDPTGRLVSRQAKGEGEVSGDGEKLQRQVAGLWEEAGGRLDLKEEDWSWRVQDNSEWLGGLGLVEFLDTLGRGVRVGAMLGRDTVRNKLEKGDGMSFAELTYPLLQAWDWWHMYARDGVQIQVGGSDQYGNIIAGIDAVKYLAQNHRHPDDRAAEGRPYYLDETGKLKENAAPMGLTVPLLTTSSGEKFGKSAGNAVWLDPEMTSPFDMYGFLLRTPDADVSRYLHLLTFLPLPSISSVMREHAANPGRRSAQHLLASELLTLVHGEKIAGETQEQHAAMRNPVVSTSHAEGAHVTLSSKEVVGVAWARVLQTAGLAISRAEGARMMKGGSVYLAAGEGKIETHFEKLGDPREVVKREDVRNGRLLLRIGKWRARVIEVVEDSDTAAGRAESGSTS